MSLYNCAPMGSMCMNTVGSYECICLSGYNGNGTVCEGKYYPFMEYNFNGMACKRSS